MNELKQFEKIPEDVKQEMLMLFETYSKNELINKLRSLREPPPESSEKTSISDSTSPESQLYLPEGIRAKSKNALTCTNSPNLNDNNASSQKSTIEYSHSINNSVSDNLGDSSNLNYKCFKNNSSFNLVLQKTNTHGTALSKISNIIEEEGPQQNDDANITSSNINKNNKRKLQIANNPKTNIQIESSVMISRNSSPYKQPPNVAKVSHVSTEARLQSKSRRQCKKGKQPEKQELILNSTNADIKSPVQTTYISPEKLNQKNKLSKTNDIDLKINKNVNLVEASIIDGNTNVVSDENKTIDLSSDLSPVKKKNVKLLKTDKIANSRNINETTDEHFIADSAVNVICDKNKITTEKNSFVEKDNIKLLKADKITNSCDINVIEPLTADSNLNIISAENKILSRKGSDSFPTKKNVKLLKTSKITDSNKQASDINVPFINPSTTDNNMNVSDENQAIRLKSSGLLLKTNKITSSSETLTSLESVVPNSDLQNVEKLASNAKTDSSVTVKQKKNIGIKNVNTEIHSLLPTNDNSYESNNSFSRKVSLNDHIKALKSVESANVPTSTEFNDQIFVTKPASLRKRNNTILKSSNKTAFSSSLKTKIIKKKTLKYSKVDANKQPSTSSNADVDLQDNCFVNIVSLNDCAKISAVNSTKSSSKKGAVDKSCISMSSIISSNNETMSELEREKASNEETKKDTHESNFSGQDKDITLNSRLREKRKDNENENCGKPLDEMQQDAEAYFRLSKLCSLHGLNLDDIFRKKEIQEMIENYKSNPEAIVFIGTHKCHNSRKIEPVVHVHKSKKVLLETLAEIQNKNSNTSKVCK